MTPLIDRFGRIHNNLRISVTDRCNIRCTYCMPEVAEFQPRENLLSYEEIARLVRVAVPLGIDKLRLTGGEPLVRRDLPELIGMLRAIEGIRDISLTTNGVLLAEQAPALFDAGLRRLNISLDTLDAVQFARLTRRDLFEKTMAGIEAARRLGFGPIKINALAIRGETESQILPLATFCRIHNLELRFIEFMPLEADQIWARDKVLTSARIREILAEGGLAVEPIANADPLAPASDFAYGDGRGKIGIIASVSEPFCDRCNRLRLTADGKLRACLFSLEEFDVKGPLRAGGTEDELARVFQECIASKWAGHHINEANYERPVRAMYSIGG